MVPVLDGLYISIPFFRRGRIVIFPVLTLLLGVLVHRLSTLRRQSGKNGDCNKFVVVICGFLNCIITHAFQELTKVE